MPDIRNTLRFSTEMDCKIKFHSADFSQVFGVNKNMILQKYLRRTSKKWIGRFPELLKVDLGLDDNIDLRF